MKKGKVEMGFYRVPVIQPLSSPTFGPIFCFRLSLVETTGLAKLVCVCKTTEPQAKPIEGGLIDVNQRFILK
jgi:hypothetical protein